MVMRRNLFLPVVLLCLAMTARADGVLGGSGGRAVPGPRVQRIIRAMGNSSTEGHPDLFGRFAGTQCYADHHYACALKYFKYGAFYADKFSQLALGLMYANGTGVQKNPIKAWAWLALASSRGYPEFVATRKRIGRQLNHGERMQAEADLRLLQLTYGDKVAERRMLSTMRSALAQMTGSRTGYDAGGITIAGPAYTVGAPSLTPLGFGNPLRDKWYWTPDKDYFAQRDAQWGGEGTVSIGKLQQITIPVRKSPAKAQAPH